MKKVIDRFLSYIAIDTMSDPKSDTTPSTKKQFDLLHKLRDELADMGLEVSLDEKGYIYASLEANTDKKLPTIGFVSHVDTSPAFYGKCVNPQFVDYEGGDIPLNEEYKLTEKEFPFLKGLKGKRLITTDGTSLLGADDKAGVAEIMTAMEYLVSHPEIKHGRVVVGFTPDEEIGQGADYFDVKRFGADFAYTMDGGPLGEFEYENFNAAGAKVHIKGKSVHPGSAKDIMINAMYVGMEFNALLPANQRPEHTEGYEGFFMLEEISGNIEACTMEYIIRDHDMEKFLEKKALMQAAADYINRRYGDILQLTIEDSYYNMKEKVEPHKEILDLALQSMKELNIEPIVRPIRGGTDGSRLSFMGLPCPNIFAGGYNFHGRFEFIPEENLIKATELIVRIVQNVAI